MSARMLSERPNRLQRLDQEMRRETKKTPLPGLGLFPGVSSVHALHGQNADSNRTILPNVPWLADPCT